MIIFRGSVKLIFKRIMRKVLEVPFLSQVDNDSSSHTSWYQECGFCAMGMVLVYLGIEGKTKGGRQLEDHLADEYGTRFGDSNRGAPLLMAKHFADYGVVDHAKYSGTVAEIRASIDRGLPVILHTDLTASGHIIIIVGYDDEKGVWIVHDPYGEYYASGYDVKVSEGKFEEYSYSLLDDKAGPDGNYWVHLIDSKHSKTAVKAIVKPEESLTSVDAKSKLLIEYSGSSGDPMVFLDAIKRQSKHLGFGIERNPFQLAYIMATVEHECAGTWEPISEWGGESTRYAPFYGRGYVQLTWKENYQKYQDILGLPLVKNPDLVKLPNVSLFILVQGMFRGVFTGLRLGHFIGGDRQHTNFVSARKIINGTDKDDEIAELAEKWLSKIS